MCVDASYNTLETIPTTQQRALTLIRVATASRGGLLRVEFHGDTAGVTINSNAVRNSYTICSIPWWKPLKQHRQTVAVG